MKFIEICSTLYAVFAVTSLIIGCITIPIIIMLSITYAILILTGQFVFMLTNTQNYIIYVLSTGNSRHDLLFALTILFVTFPIISDALSSLKTFCTKKFLY